MYKIVIIDDEPLAHNILEEYLENRPEFRVVGNAHDGFEGLKLIQQTQPDLLLLDIQMPKINGFELLEVINENPEVIFTTAFDEFALRAFETNAVDYLLKPIAQDRFDQAIDRFLSRQNAESNTSKLLEIPNKQPEEADRVVIKDGTEIKIIPTAEIEFIEAYDDYVKIHHHGRTHLKKKTMNYYEQTLNPKTFVRIHRSFILNINALTRIESMEKNSYHAVLKSGKRIPISRTAYTPLKALLGI